MKNQTAQSNLCAFLSDLDEIKSHEDDDSAFENELEDYRNDDSDGIICLHPSDLASHELARLDKLVEAQDAIFSASNARVPVQTDSSEKRYIRVRRAFTVAVPSRCKSNTVIGRQELCGSSKERRSPNVEGRITRGRNACQILTTRAATHFIIEALKALGANRSHAFGALRAKVEELMGVERWRAFANRESARSCAWDIYDTDADAEERLRYNCRVLQRTKNYGLKLLQVGREIMGTAGCVVEIVHQRDQTTYCLNTNSDKSQDKTARERHRSIVESATSRQIP